MGRKRKGKEIRKGITVKKVSILLERCDGYRYVPRLINKLNHDIRGVGIKNDAETDKHSQPQSSKLQCKKEQVSSPHISEKLCVIIERCDRSQSDHHLSKKENHRIQSIDIKKDTEKDEHSQPQSPTVGQIRETQQTDKEIDDHLMSNDDSQPRCEEDQISIPDIISEKLSIVIERSDNSLHDHRLSNKENHGIRSIDSNKNTEIDEHPQQPQSTILGQIKDRDGADREIEGHLISKDNSQPRCEKDQILIPDIISENAIPCKIDLNDPRLELVFDDKVEVVRNSSHENNILNLSVVNENYADLLSPTVSPIDMSTKVNKVSIISSETLNHEVILLPSTAYERSITPTFEHFQYYEHTILNEIEKTLDQDDQHLQINEIAVFKDSHDVPLGDYVEGDVDNIGDDDNDDHTDDPSYLPSDISDTDNSLESNLEEPKESKRSSITKEQDLINKNSVNSSADSTGIIESAINDEILSVPVSDGKKKKQYFCYYCKKLITKLPRHLEAKHKNEDDVKKFMILPKGNEERKRIIETISRKGNCFYNTSSDYNKDKTLLVTRRPKSGRSKTAKDFAACKYCRGFFSKTSLRHHVLKCRGSNQKDKSNVLVMSRRLIRRIHEDANSALKKQIFPRMQEDDVVRRIRYDRLVILYGNQLCDKYRTSQHHRPMIRSTLRLIGRFLLSVDKHLNYIIPFEDVFDPTHYRVVSNAIEDVAGLTSNKDDYRAPTNAANLGTFIKQAGKVLIADCIEKKKPEKKKDAEDFLMLIETRFATTINKIVTESQLKRKREKIVILPQKEDIFKFHSYVKRKHEIALTSMKKGYSLLQWMALIETSVILSMTFCRRRPGEIERLKIAEFRAYEGLSETKNEQIFNNLTPEQKKTAKKYVRFQIRGKKARTVPVILSTDLVEAFELIIKFRETAGVPPENPFVFGLPGNIGDEFKYIRCCPLMRQYSAESKVSNPEAIRATTLRKHAATDAIAQSLSDNSVSMLAEFMGHAEKVHKENYRQPVLIRDILEVGKFLEKALGNEPDLSSDSDDSDQENASKNTDELDSSTEESQTPTKKPRIEKTSKKITFNERQKMDSNVKLSAERRAWTKKERSIVTHAFSQYFEDPKQKKMPSLKEIKKLVDDNPCLTGRSAPSIKTWMHNQKKLEKEIADLLE